MYTRIFQVRGAGDSESQGAEKWLPKCGSQSRFREPTVGTETGAGYTNREQSRSIGSFKSQLPRPDKVPKEPREPALRCKRTSPQVGAKKLLKELKLRVEDRLALFT